MACSCGLENGSASWYADRQPIPVPVVAAPDPDAVPEWVRELFQAVVVALIVALIMRQSNT